jgi:hypothetical protein
MVDARLQQQVDQLLDQIEDASRRQAFGRLLDLTVEVVLADPTNEVVERWRALAERKHGRGAHGVAPPERDAPLAGALPGPTHRCRLADDQRGIIDDIASSQARMTRGTSSVTCRPYHEQSSTRRCGV